MTERSYSVDETARRLAVGARRVRALVAEGRLDAEKVGNRWVVGAGSIDNYLRHPRKGGRPVSAGNAWGILALLSGEEPSWVHPSVRSRLRRRLEEEAWLEAALLTSEPRARVHRWRVLSSDLERATASVVLTGISARHPGVALSPRGELDGYISRVGLEEIGQELQAVVDSDQPNLWLRVPSHGWVLSAGPVAPAAVVAADLLESAEPRVWGEGKRLLLELIQAYW